MQAVYISNRPERLRETLDHVQAFLPWLDRAVVVAPREQVGAFSPPPHLAVSWLPEEELLGPLHDRFAATSDHQRRNLLLRLCLATAPDVEPHFLMSDDDARPLGPVPPAAFREAGRDHGYVMHRLDHWPASATDFDRGQLATARVLAEAGCETLSYAAHMPQLVDREMLRELPEALPGLLETESPLDEWSLYANVARRRHPDRFHPPRPYETLAWPAQPTDWPLVIRPPRFTFENFHPPLYEPGGLFGDLPASFQGDEQLAINAEKIRRRTRQQARYEGLPARLLRRIAWALHRAARTTRRRGWDRGLPPSLGALVARLEDRGHDPAWSFRLLDRRTGHRNAGQR